MKRIVLTISLLFVVVILFSQTWNTLIPYETTDPLNVLKKLIKTQDGGFLSLIYKVEQVGFQKSISAMYKYSEEGELEWEKNYDFGAMSGGGGSNIGGARPIDVVQLQNGNFFTTGVYIDADTVFLYAFVTDLFGDSISVKAIPGAFNLNYVNGNIYIRDIDSMDNKFFLKLDDYGEIETEFLIDEEVVWRTIVNEDEEIFLFRGLGIGRGIKKLSINGELLIDNVEFDNVADYAAINELNGVTTYENELIKLDNTLNEVWSVPFEDIFSIGSALDYDASGIIHTLDEGYVVYGKFFNFIPPHNVYIIKYDKEGEREWGGIYGGNYLPLEHIQSIVEVEDGYVILGGNSITEQLWLVKLNEEGVFTNTEEAENIFVNTRLYPNPANHKITIDLSQSFSGNIRLYNMLGQVLVDDFVNHTQQLDYNIASYPPGYYYLQLLTFDNPNQPITLPFIKQ